MARDNYPVHVAIVFVVVGICCDALPLSKRIRCCERSLGGRRLIANKNLVRRGPSCAVAVAV